MLRHQEKILDSVYPGVIVKKKVIRISSLIYGFNLRFVCRIRYTRPKGIALTF